MMDPQAKTTGLYGQPRDYPDAPQGFTKAQSDWWAIVRRLLRQQDQELQEIRARLNLPIPPTS